mgnify:CR=1 FL=1
MSGGGGVGAYKYVYDNVILCLYYSPRGHYCFLYKLCCSSQAALMGESIAHVTTWVLPQSRQEA